MKIQPLADRVLVEPLEAETKTAGGIIIPDTAKEKPQKGKVAAIGKGTKDEPMSVAVGDEVIYGKYSGTEVQIDGKDYLIMKASEIYGVLKA
jgi:chaperonin GroES